jgi:aryl-alcohol dehydrogenase-like predicted oxidoreductase
MKMKRLADRKVIEAVGEVAEQRGIPRAQVALAWLMQKEAVSAPIISVTKSHHLHHAVAAMEPYPRQSRDRARLHAACHRRTSIVFMTEK